MLKTSIVLRCLLILKGLVFLKMGDLERLAQIDWWYVFIAVVLLLVCIKFVWSVVDWFLFEKLGIETKAMKQRREDREQLNAVTKLAGETAVQLRELKEIHLKDESVFRHNLNDYIEESRKDRKALHDEMARFADNRVNDRKQSIEIQRELKDSISETDERIDALIVANKEMLAEKINEKYKYYTNLGGIPADEYDEFVSMHKAYKGLGGNSHGDAKFEYCITHLPVIPVETKLVYKH